MPPADPRPRRFEPLPERLVLVDLFTTFSSWICAIEPTELLLLDMGAAPAFRAALRDQIGLSPSQLLLPGDGDTDPASAQRLAQFCEHAHTRAKAIKTIPDPDLVSLSIHRSMGAHRLHITAASSGKPHTHTFSFATREHVPHLIAPLSARFASRFHTTQSPAYAWTRRYAPFVAK